MSTVESVGKFADKEAGVGIVNKLIDGRNIEISVPTKQLHRQKRKEVAHEYYDWLIRVETRNAKYVFTKLIGAGILIAGFFQPLILLLLIPLWQITMKAQFDWGDLLDDKERWESKTVVRMDL